MNGFKVLSKDRELPTCAARPTTSIGRDFLQPDERFEINFDEKWVAWREAIPFQEHALQTVGGQIPKELERLVGY